MQRYKKTENWIVGTAAVLLCLVLASFWFTCNLYARYTTQSTGGDSARVAAFVFDLTEGSESQMTKLENITKPGDSQTVMFTVTNQNGSRISEVAESYTVNLEAEGNLPITCVVTKDEQDFLSVDTTKTNKATSQEIMLQAAQSYTQTYVLTAEWPEGKNDAAYAGTGTVAAVTLTVQAQQTKGNM